jgi:hypothetical protein
MNKPRLSLTDSPSPLPNENLAAIDEFIARARMLSEAQWETPRVANKWTLCREAQHLSLSFGFFTDAVLGRHELALQVSPERSLVRVSIQRSYGLDRLAPSHVSPPGRAGESKQRRGVHG